MLQSSKKSIIIFLVNSGNYFGAEKINVKIIKKLQTKYLFYYASPKGSVDKILKEHDIRHIIISKIDRKTIRNIEKIYHPDLIHATDYKTSVMCALANIKTPFISHLHSSVPWLDKIHPYTIAYLLAAEKAKKIITVSDSIEKRYIFSTFVQNKFQCILNPVCSKEILSKAGAASDKRYDICFVGRLSEEKQPLLFLDIIKSLKKKYPNLKTIMLGDGDLRKKVVEKIKKEQMTEYVLWKGFQSNPYKFMNQSKILLLTSRYEGCPLVVLEALVLGLPCVVADVGGLSDILTDKCGFLCKEKSSYQKYLSILLKHTSIYEKYSDESRKRAMFLENRFHYMEKVDNCYQQILEEREYGTE